MQPYYEYVQRLNDELIETTCIHMCPSMPSTYTHTHTHILIHTCIHTHTIMQPYYEYVQRLNDELIEAAEEGNNTGIEMLLEMGASVNTLQVRGLYVCMFVCMCILCVYVSMYACV
jgi:hypothetical protein